MAKNPPSTDLDDEVELPSVEVKRRVVTSPSPFITVEGEVLRYQGFVIPPEAFRIKIVDDKGQTKFRKLENLAAGDIVVVNDAGLPIFMESPNGRPKKLPSGGLLPATPLIGDLLRIKQAHMRNDAIIQAAETTPESPDVLNQVVLAIGEEAASLRFERMEAERKGEDTSTLSMRRVAALKAIGDTWIKRKEQINSKVIDLESPSFQVLFQFLAETFARAMQNAGLRQELADTIMSQFVKLLDDSWKNEAKSRMKE